jgi:hypothetical protein
LPADVQELPRLYGMASDSRAGIQRNSKAYLPGMREKQRARGETGMMLALIVAGAFYRLSKG